MPRIRRRPQLTAVHCSFAATASTKQSSNRERRDAVTRLPYWEYSRKEDTMRPPPSDLDVREPIFGGDRAVIDDPVGAAAPAKRMRTKAAMTSSMSRLRQCQRHFHPDPHDPFGRLDGQSRRNADAFSGVATVTSGKVFRNLFDNENELKAHFAKPAG
jgi:hypothetical protein